MMNKIPLEQIYIADLVRENITVIYNNMAHITTVVHQPIIDNKKAFLALSDENGKLIGYVCLEDNTMYKPMNLKIEPYELAYKDTDEKGIEEGSKFKTGFVNFEPLKTYFNSVRGIKPTMTLKSIDKVLGNINKQRKNLKPKILRKIT